MQRPRLGAAGSFVLALSALLPACAADTFYIPERELARLVETPPHERGRSLRVVQRMEPADEPPSQPSDWEPYAYEESSAGGVVAEGMVRGALEVHVVAPIHAGPTHPHAVDSVGGPSGSPGLAPSLAGGAGKSSASALQLSRIEDEKALAIAVVVMAAAGTFVLAASEGMRYDGFVSVDPNHPVYLMRSDGMTETVPLAELDRRDLRPGITAVLDPGDGAGMAFEGRAPLDREGFAWRLEGGLLPFALAGDERAAGPGAVMSFGYFPAPTLGLLGTVGLGGGSTDGGEFFGARYGFEANWMPLVAERLHLGAFGFAGLVRTDAAGGFLEPVDSLDTALAAGGVLEVELTTRLSLLARVGPSFRHDQDQGRFVWAGVEATLGFSIY